MYHLTKNPIFCQTNLKIQYIIVWFGYQDKFDKLLNFNLYQIGNKTIAVKKLLCDIKIAEIKSRVTKEKAQKKLGTIIKLYKDWRNKAQTTRWGVDLANHYYIANKSIGSQTIQEVLILKCPQYYKFEAIIGGLPKIAPPFFMELENLN